MFTWLKVFWALLLLAVGIGLSHGAKLKFDLWELRSWIYLTLGILIAAVFIKTKRALDVILWIFVLGSGFKGIQGTIIFFEYARHMHPEAGGNPRARGGVLLWDVLRHHVRALVV